MSILQFPHSISLNKVKKITDEIIQLSGQLRQKPVSHFSQQKIFHHQVLKSSLFSARIEGSGLTLAQAKKIDLKNPKEKSKLEVSNVLHVLQDISKLPNKISVKTILFLHKQVMKKVDHRAGKFRNESSGIFDGLGNIVYLTPEPENIFQMFDVLLGKINQELDYVQQLIITAQCHYYFEKIHPFVDGNGRVGRVLMQYQLQKTNFFADYILPIDEYFEKNRSSYYFFLGKNTRNIEEFVVFFLEGVVFSLRELLKNIDNLSEQERLVSETSSVKSGKKNDKKISDIKPLLPRRQELINIIQDHPYISLDSLSRRFPTIPRRTIAYDVNWLVKNNFVIKHGETRGVRYSVK